MTHLRSASLVLSFVFFAFSGCDVGGVAGPGPGPGGGSGADAGQASNTDAAPGTPDAAPADYALSVPQTPTELSLGQNAELRLTLTSSHFTGPVTLSAAGYPDSWSVTFEPSSTVNLTADGSVDVTVGIAIPTDGKSGASDINFTAQASPGMRNGSASVSVANELTIVIPNGTGSGNHSFPVDLPVHVGTRITFLNSDGTPHRIHSNNEAAGFPHEGGDMTQGQSYTFTFSSPGGFGYYCHDHEGSSGVGSFAVTPVLATN